MKKSLSKLKGVTLKEFIGHKIYDPYKEELVIEEVSEGEIRLYLPGEWTAVLNSDEGTFTVLGDIRKYYDIDRIKDIRDNFGAIFSVYRLNNINITVT